MKLRIYRTLWGVLEETDGEKACYHFHQCHNIMSIIIAITKTNTINIITNTMVIIIITSVAAGDIDHDRYQTRRAAKCHILYTGQIFQTTFYLMQSA